MLSPASSSIKGVASESITYGANAQFQKPQNRLNKAAVGHGPNMATLSAAQGRVQTQISAV